jgi:RHS repeat-associated protein
VSYAYDAIGLVNGIVLSDGTGNFQLLHNPDSTLSNVSNNSVMDCAFSYDDAGRLSAINDTQNPAITNGLSVSYGYDADGNILSRSLGGLLGQIARDPVGRISSIAYPDGEASFEYDVLGNVELQTTSDGTTKALAHDANSRVTQLQIQYNGSSTSNDYQYSNNGFPVEQNGQETWRYDSLGRLTWWRNPADGTIFEYQYNQEGDLAEIRRNGIVERSWQYDQAGRITNPGYTYDAAGNLSSDGEKQYLYDARNQLVEVRDTVSGNLVASYSYDYLGRRITKATEGGATYYHWEGNKIIAESDDQGIVRATYVYDDYGTPLFMRRDGITYFYQTDRHGDVVSLTDQGGNIVNSYAYDPWGRTITANETVYNPLRYAGYLYDSETNQYYLLSRYYSPQLCRFTSRDTLIGMGSSPLTFNGYIYCCDNPVVYRDSLGMNPEGENQPWYETLKDLVEIFKPLVELIEWARGWAEPLIGGVLEVIDLIAYAIWFDAIVDTGYFKDFKPCLQGWHDSMEAFDIDNAKAYMIANKDLVKAENPELYQEYQKYGPAIFEDPEARNQLDEISEERGLDLQLLNDPND